MHNLNRIGAYLRTGNTTYFYSSEVGAHNFWQKIALEAGELNITTILEDIFGSIKGVRVRVFAQGMP